MTASPAPDFSFEARLDVAITSGTSPLPSIGAWAGFLTTAAILLFDVAAAMGASGWGVGTLPVGAALAIAPCYVVLVAMMHQDATEFGRLWTIMGLAFALLYAGVVSLNYALQLTVVPQNPEAFAGWTLELRPDSAFWALEVMGYSYMGLSALALVPVLRSSGRRRIAGWLFVVNALCTLVGAAAYLISRDPSQPLAVGSLLVWGLVFPIATFLIALDFVRASRGTRS